LNHHINNLLNTIPEKEQALLAIFKILQFEDIYSNTALALACIDHVESKKEDKYNCILLLLKYGSTPNVRNSVTGFTPLHWAARYGELEIVKLLYEYDAKLCIPDRNGYLPIDYAGMFKQENVVEFLLNIMYTQVLHTLANSDDFKHIDKDVLNKHIAECNNEVK